MGGIVGGRAGDKVGADCRVGEERTTFRRATHFFGVEIWVLLRVGT